MLYTLEHQPFVNRFTADGWDVGIDVIMSFLAQWLPVGMIGMSLEEAEDDYIRKLFVSHCIGFLEYDIDKNTFEITQAGAKMFIPRESEATLVSTLIEPILKEWVATETFGIVPIDTTGNTRDEAVQIFTKFYLKHLVYDPDMSMFKPREDLGQNLILRSSVITVLTKFVDSLMAKGGREGLMSNQGDKGGVYQVSTNQSI